MRHTITGQRRTDRARRTVLVGTLAAVTPIVTPAATIAASWDLHAIAAATMVSTVLAAGVVGILLYRVTRRLARQQEQFDEERRRWRDEANTDPLCRIANRRGAYDHVDRLLRSADATAAWTVLAIDIDHFKQVNDTHGHAVGDRVLAAVASALDDHAPPGSTVARWGGDEFVVFALGHDELPSGWAETIADAVAAHPVRCREGDLHVGISFGAARGPATDSFDEVLAVADDALLAAKARIRRPIRLDEREPEVTTVALRPFAGQPAVTPIVLAPAAG